MLHIYPVILNTIEELRGAGRVIERRDRDLARQLRRAASSVALNVVEGQYSQGALRRTRLHTALGSARETLACLETAVAWGYLPRVEESVAVKLNRVIGSLVRLVT